MIIRKTEHQNNCDNADKYNDVITLNNRIAKLFGSIDGFFEFCNAKNPSTSAHQFKNRSSNKGGTTVKFIEVLEMIATGRHDDVMQNIERHKLYYEMCNERKRNRKQQRGAKQNDM